MKAECKNDKRFIVTIIDLETYKTTKNKIDPIISKIKDKYLRLLNKKDSKIHCSRKKLDRIIAAYDLHLKGLSLFAIANQLAEQYDSRHNKTAKASSFTKQVKQDIERAETYIKSAPVLSFSFENQ